MEIIRNFIIGLGFFELLFVLFFLLVALFLLLVGSILLWLIGADESECGERSLGKLFKLGALVLILANTTGVVFMLESIKKWGAI